jgi:hypothetical protein
MTGATHGLARGLQAVAGSRRRGLWRLLDRDRRASLFRAGLLRRVVTMLAFLASLQTASAVEQATPAANMRDTQAHFIQCFRAPTGMENMQGTFHYSLNREGGLIGPPRIAWLKLDKPHQSQKQLEARLIEAFDRCIPVPLTREMSRMTPGNVLYFRFGAAPRRGKDKSRPVFNGPLD